MPNLAQQNFLVGKWRVQPNLNLVSCDASVTHLEPKVMAVLVCLAEHAGEVVLKEQLIRTVWADTFVTDQVLTHAIWQLRQALGNGSKRSEIIETIPKRGYRLVPPVQTCNLPGPGHEVATATSEVSGSIARFTSSWRALLLAGAAVLLLVGVVLALAGGWRRVLRRWPAAPVRTIAVLPLDNLSGDPQQEYFADGMTEQLITDLAKISGLRVISRTSVMAYKTARKPLPEIGRELQVDTVVEGSIQRSGGRVRITAQLIDVHSQQHLWAETYDRDFKDVLSIGGEVARAIAAEVKIKLTPEEKTRLSRPRAVVPEAYEAYLLGQYFATRGKPADYRKSIEYFRQAVNQDPSYALAYAEMAESYAMLDFMADLRGENFHQAEQAARRALELDPQLPEARIRVADLRMYWDWDWSKCDTVFRDAVRLDPGSADAQAHFATCLHILGRYQEALQESERAVRLDPLSPVSHRFLGRLLADLGQHQHAIEEYRKAVELEPNEPNAHGALGFIYEALQQHENAIAEWEAEARLRGAPAAGLAELREAFQTGGMDAYRAQRRKYLQRRLSQRKAAASYTWVSPVELAQLCTVVGQTDEAFQWLNQAYEHRSPRLVWLKTSPTFAPLRSDPRFQHLLRRMNFPDSKP